MATHASAEKRHRQNLKRREQNRQVRSTLRSALKKTEEAIKSGDLKKAEEQVRATTRLFDKAAVHKVLHRNNASRHISTINRKLAALKPAKSAKKK